MWQSGDCRREAWTRSKLVENSLQERRVRLDRPAVLVADNADAGGPSSRRPTVRERLLRGGTCGKSILAAGSEHTGRDQAGVDDGASLDELRGHAATAVSAREHLQLPGREQPPDQSRQPLLLTMNSLNGFFHLRPERAQRGALKADGKGAITAFSPSGLSLTTPRTSPQGPAAGVLLRPSPEVRRRCSRSEGYAVPAPSRSCPSTTSSETRLSGFDQGTFPRVP